MKRSYISLIESGTVEPGLTVQERLAAALGISLAELIADAERERDRYRATREQAATNPATPAPIAAPTKKQDRKDRPVAMAIVVKDSRALMTHRR